MRARRPRARILEYLGPALVGRRLDRFEDAPSLLRDAYAQAGGSGPSGAAQCAVELAVLDAAGRAFGHSVADLLDPRVRCELVYSGVLPFLPAQLMLLGARLHRLYGVTAVKLKVGRSLREDLRNLKLLRAVLGARADLRVDANCAWRPDQAVEAIRLMRRYRIRAVEQPVDKADFVGLKRVADAVDIPIMADESLRTPDDARRLTAERAVGMFNIRISKCGGLLAAREMAQIAARSGITCQLGPHPGESAILTAAGLRPVAGPVGQLGQRVAGDAAGGEGERGLLLEAERPRRAAARIAQRSAVQAHALPETARASLDQRVQQRILLQRTVRLGRAASRCFRHGTPPAKGLDRPAKPVRSLSRRLALVYWHVNEPAATPTESSLRTQPGTSRTPPRP